MTDLPAIPPASTTQVTRFLHVNHNCVSIPASRELYTSLFGMREVMYNESTDADGGLMDMPGILDSAVSFLYDRRGARRSPSLELVEWGARPGLARHRYAQPNEVGMQAVAYTVPSLAAVLSAVEAAGLATGSVSLAGADALLFADPDGVNVEVYEDTSLEHAASRHLRLTVSDLDRSRGWYESIGFVTQDQSGEQPCTWVVPGTDVPVAGSVRTARVAIPGDGSYAIELTQWVTPASHGSPKQGGADQGLFRMALAVEDTRESRAALIAAGWPYVGEPKCHQLAGTPLPDLWITFTKDPDLITVELVQRPVATYTDGARRAAD